ncbi:MAG: bifunctional hydroxymethylpyrimidine kinase/phosphomethylpyrimidine kinase [Pseudomonadota bacterium]|nr:bifunctional hydroxymethylpyrimidine kinase/phosphomethylpyrimidine kinase [Pseudomonadota bacterium]
MLVDAKLGRVLIAAGSDSGGGAGIQADIKTVTALGGFAMTAITALTAQNTTGVYGVIPVETDFIAQQIHVVLDDLGVDYLKTGMMHSAEVIETLMEVLEDVEPNLPVVVDPVMFAKGGHALLEEKAIDVLRGQLVPRAEVVTPNVPEAEVLAGTSISGIEDMKRAGEAIVALGAEAALIKGGHLSGDVLTDVLITRDGIELFQDLRIDTKNTHGTGCTLASAIATGLANGLALPEAVARGRKYVRAAILAAPGFGSGHGPMDHGHPLRP